MEGLVGDVWGLSKQRTPITSHLRITKGFFLYNAIDRLLKCCVARAYVGRLVDKGHLPAMFASKQIRHLALLYCHLLVNLFVISSPLNTVESSHTVPIITCMLYSHSCRYKCQIICFIFSPASNIKI